MYHTWTVRLPDLLTAEIEAESRKRRMPKSDVVRERLQRAKAEASDAPLVDIRDLIGSVDGVSGDLSAHTKHHFRATGFGRDRRR
jgi:hypothetical protein